MSEDFAGKTANQIVAFNMRRRRRELGWTQERLGTALALRTGKPWSNATMSSAEQSWVGKRIRNFDADELVAIADALNIPVSDLFAEPALCPRCGGEPPIGFDCRLCGATGIETWESER